jgi:RNA polymerase sigma-70 factor, ECF subfamily
MDFKVDGGVSSDEELAAIVALRQEPQGDWQAARQACEQLYLRHARRLLAFLSARVNRSDLEDIHQAVWERVWQRVPEGFHGGNFRAWLYQIARNYLIDMRRKKTPSTPGDEALEVAGKDAGADVWIAEQERIAILQRCLSNLNSEAASLVRARLSGESYDEICRRTGWKTERAHKLFHQAKQELQTCIQRADV